MIVIRTGTSGYDTMMERALYLVHAEACRDAT